jgi:hypothetical protein
MPTIKERLMAAITAFREPYLVVDQATAGDEWGQFEARQLRYAILWAWYESTIYRDIHSFSKKLKTDYGLYKYVRPVYNPAARICNFYKDHVWGGLLDSQAADAGALPIETDNEALRAPIAQLWEWSNWQSKKDVATLWGAIYGDVALQVVDDTERGKVYIKPVNSMRLKEVTLDPFGNVKGYIIEYQRLDPENGTRSVTYTEQAEREDDLVVYSTFMNNAPFAWNGIADSWEEKYGFIPMVMVNHIDVGVEWGWSELHQDLAKFREVDDLASKFNDHIRKTVDPGWLFAGVNAPQVMPSATGSTPTTSRPAPDREEIPILYGPAGAQPHALVAPLDLGGVNASINSMLAEIERDYPELRLLLMQSGGEVSGRALRIAQKPVEAKVQERRGRYDKALVKAHQMALSIGGFRKVEGFTAFSLDSYAAGTLDHSIAKRDVFATDILDDYEIEASFWTAAEGVLKGGGSLELWLTDQGWDEEKVDKWRGSPETKARLAQLEGTVTQMEMMANYDQTDGGIGPEGEPAVEVEPEGGQPEAEPATATGTPAEEVE